MYRIASDFASDFIVLVLSEAVLSEAVLSEAVLSEAVLVLDCFEYEYRFTEYEYEYEKKYEYDEEARTKLCTEVSSGRLGTSI